MKMIQLGKYISEYSERNKSGEELPVYSVTNSEGFCKDYFSKDVSSQDRTTYKVVPRGYFAYNPSRINVGSVDWQHCEERVIVSPLYVVFKVSDSLDQQYLYYYLKSDKCLYFIKQLASGSVRDNLRFSSLKEFLIPDISIKEQKQVVKTLDHVSNLIYANKQQLAKLDELVKSRFVELTEMAPTTPTRMGDIATYLNGYAFKPDQWEDKGLPIIRIQNLNNPDAAYNYYSGELAEKYLVLSGDVLVSWATHLEAYVWKGESAWLNQHIFKVVFDKMDVDKIYFVFATEEALRQAFKNAHGFKPTMEHIKKADFDNAVVKLPPLPVQREFSRFAQQVDKSKLAVKQSLEKLEMLKKSLMQQYFG